MGYLCEMIRRADIKDIELLQEIGRKTFDDTFGNTCTKEDMRGVLEMYFNTAQVTSELLNKEDNFFFYEENGEVKGYMRINAINPCPLDFLRNKKCMELVRLYVLREYHGTSVASKLMNFAIEFAQKNGYEAMYLSVWEYNFRARGFYEKQGFTNSGFTHDFPLGSTPQTDLWFVKEF